MYAISTDEENYTCEGMETESEQIAEAVAQGLTEFWIGKQRRPTHPEYLWEAADWFDLVSVQDDYAHEYADWPDFTTKQSEELEESVRKVMSEWLNKHDLRPTHFMVDEPSHYIVNDGVAEKLPA